MSQKTLLQLEEYLLKQANTKYSNMDLGKQNSLIIPPSNTSSIIIDPRHRQFLTKIF